MKYIIKKIKNKINKRKDPADYYIKQAIEIIRENAKPEK